MKSREYNQHVRAMADHATAMSIEGLKLAILDDWNNPEWSPLTFDAMNLALQRKMGKRRYDAWFNALPVNPEA